MREYRKSVLLLTLCVLICGRPRAAVESHVCINRVSTGTTMTHKELINISASFQHSTAVRAAFLHTRRAGPKLTAWQIAQLVLTILGAVSTLTFLAILFLGFTVAGLFIGGGVAALVAAGLMLLLAAAVVVAEVFWVRYLLRRWKRKNAARQVG